DVAPQRGIERGLLDPGVDAEAATDVVRDRVLRVVRIGVEEASDLPVIFAQDLAAFSHGRAPLVPGGGNEAGGAEPGRARTPASVRAPATGRRAARRRASRRRRRPAARTAAGVRGGGGGVTRWRDQPQDLAPGAEAAQRFR